jgi:hypothetical protein
MESKSDSISSQFQNPGAVHLKTDAHVTYDISLGYSWPHWKYKDITFSMGPVSYPTKIGVYQNC